MHLSYSKTGKASVAMELAQLEDIFRVKGAHRAGNATVKDRQDDWMIYANFLVENANVLSGAAAKNDGQTFANAPVKITETAKKRFVSILSRVKQAHEGISRQERLFVHKFWLQLQNSILRRPSPNV